MPNTKRNTWQRCFCQKPCDLRASGVSLYSLIFSLLSIQVAKLLTGIILLRLLRETAIKPAAGTTNRTQVLVCWMAGGLTAFRMQRSAIERPYGNGGAEPNGAVEKSKKLAGNSAPASYRPVICIFLIRIVLTRTP